MLDLVFALNNQISMPNALLIEILEEEIATYTEKPHVHFKDGTALNQDGTVHDAHKGKPNLTNGTRKWVERKLKNEILWI